MSPWLSVRPAAAASLRVRRDVMELADTDPFFAQYAKAVAAMHALPETDGRNWRRQAKIHADHCKHGQLQFLHWHRHYINFFEAICGELIGEPGFALPYWNWSKKSGVIPAPFFDKPELNVEHWNDPGKYWSANWGPVDTVGKRGLVKGRGLLDDPVRGGAFTTATLDGIKKLTRASLFESSLEGTPHNSGHVVAGATASGKTGHVGDGLSPLDPIFWLHHCMVDRLWAEWQSTGNVTPDPAATYSGNFFGAMGTMATVTAAGALDHAKLGYTYDVLVKVSAAKAPITRGTLVEAILPGLEKALREQEPPRTLGSATSTDVSAPLIATQLNVSTPGLLRTLEGSHAFREMSAGQRPSINVEGGRVLALFTDVIPPEGQPDLVVNVFVNCPYLSPATGYADPHYAGTFSFFGRVDRNAMDHGTMGHEFVIDITSPVRKLAQEGKLKEEQITVQLMPLPAYIDGKSASTFNAGRVEIIGV